MSYSRNIRLLYLAIFFRNLIFAYVIERLFAMERGMTVQMVVYTEIIYGIVIAVLEIPSGALADRLGRKPMLVVGAAVTCLEFFVLIFAHGFAFFGLSAAIAGIAGACTSGAWNAFLYDSLSASGRSGEFEKVLGRSQAVDFISALIAGLSGAVLAGRFGYAFNYWLSTGSGFVAFILMFRLAEPPKSSAVDEAEPSLTDIARAAFRFFKSHAGVFWVAVHTALIAACVNYVDEFWQVYLGEIAFPLALFGVASAALTLTRAPGALLASALLRRISHRSLILLSSLLTAAGILWAAWAKNSLGIAGMALMCFAVALMEPAMSGYLHRRADPAARATIESAVSLFERAFSMGVGLLFGYVSSRFSIFGGFGILGFLAAGTCAGFALSLAAAHFRRSST